MTNNSEDLTFVKPKWQTNEMQQKVHTLIRQQQQSYEVNQMQAIQHEKDAKNIQQDIKHRFSENIEQWFHLSTEQLFKLEFKKKDRFPSKFHPSNQIDLEENYLIEQERVHNQYKKLGINQDKQDELMNRKVNSPRHKPKMKQNLELNLKTLRDNASDQNQNDNKLSKTKKVESNITFNNFNTHNTMPSSHLLDLKNNQMNNNKLNKEIRDIQFHRSNSNNRRNNNINNPHIKSNSNSNSPNHNRIFYHSSSPVGTRKMINLNTKNKNENSQISEVDYTIFKNDIQKIDIAQALTETNHQNILDKLIQDTDKNQNNRQDNQVSNKSEINAITTRDLNQIEEYKKCNEYNVKDKVHHNIQNKMMKKEKENNQNINKGAFKQLLSNFKRNK